MLCSRCPVHYDRGVCPQCGRSQPGRESRVDLSRYAVDGQVELATPYVPLRDWSFEFGVSYDYGTGLTNGMDRLELTALQRRVIRQYEVRVQRQLEELMGLPSNLIEPDTDVVGRVFELQAPCGNKTHTAFREGKCPHCKALPLDGRCQSPNHCRDHQHPIWYVEDGETWDYEISEGWDSLYKSHLGWLCRECSWMHGYL